jgi:hypothetical protein
MRRSHLSHTFVSSVLAVAVILGLAPAAYPDLVPCTPSVGGTVNKVECTATGTVGGTVDKVECTADKVDPPCTPAKPCLPDPKVCWPDVDPPCKRCGPDLPCKKIACVTEEFVLPMDGRPQIEYSPCIPAGAYVSGQQRVRVTVITSTCGMRIRTQTSTCGAKFIAPLPDRPGQVGCFSSSEFTFDEIPVDNASVEVTSYHSFRARLEGCRDSYRVDTKLKIRVDPCTGLPKVSFCTYEDCYTPCCGDPD